MSFTDIGYIRETLEQTLARVVNRFRSVLPSVSIDQSSIVYQIMKLVALAEQDIQSQIEDAVAQISILGSSGIYTEYHGIEGGIFRKDGVAAEGYIQATSTTGTSLPISMAFSTTQGVGFTTKTATTYPTYATVKRGRNETDGMPSQYNSFTIDKIYEEASLVNEITGSAWEYDTTSGVVTWYTHNALVSSFVPDYGQYYYCSPSGGSMRLNIPIVCDEYGTSGNVGAQLITQFDSAQVNGGTITNVYNETGLDNGTILESLQSYKRRVVQRNRTAFGTDYIRDLIEQIDGVRHARVYGSYATNRSVVDDWNTITGYTDEEIVLNDTGLTYGFSFYPSSGIGTLKGITIRGKATSTPGDLYIYLNWHGSGQYLTGTTGADALAYTTIDRGILNKYGQTVAQDMYLPIFYPNMDHTKTYRLYIQPKNVDANKYWTIYCTGAQADDNYRLGTFTGNTLNGTTGIIYKIHHGGGGYNATITPEDGYEYETILAKAQTGVTNIDTGGYSPYGVVVAFAESTKKYLSISGKLYIESSYTFADVVTDIKTNLDTYLDTLIPGDNVIYSQIEKHILLTNGVYKIREMSINLDDESATDNTTELDLPIEDNEYAVLDDAGAYNGIVFTEG